MRYIKVLSIMACCLALASPSAFCAGVINGDFEAGTLDPWGMTGAGTGYAISTVAPHSGNYCALATKAEGGLGGLVQNFALAGGVEIKASFWYKALGTQWTWGGGSYGESSLVEMDAGGNQIKHNYLALLGLNFPAPTADWTLVTQTIVTDPATVSAQIYMNAQVAQGDQLFLDDYSVVPTAPVPEPAGLAVLACGILPLIARRRR